MECEFHTPSLMPRRDFIRQIYTSIILIVILLSIVLVVDAETLQTFARKMLLVMREGAIIIWTVLEWLFVIVQTVLDYL